MPFISRSNLSKMCTHLSVLRTQLEMPVARSSLQLVYLLYFVPGNPPAHLTKTRSSKPASTEGCAEQTLNIWMACLQTIRVYLNDSFKEIFFMWRWDQAWQFNFVEFVTDSSRSDSCSCCNNSRFFDDATSPLQYLVHMFLYADSKLIVKFCPSQTGDLTISPRRFILNFDRPGMSFASSTASLTYASSFSATKWPKPIN